jgi:hypothetical protein
MVVGATNKLVVTNVKKEENMEWGS